MNLAASKITPSRILQNRSGFTLIEIIIAITMLSFLMIALYSLVEDSTNTKENVVKEDREYMDVQTALYRFDQDFMQIYSPLYFSSITSNKKKKKRNRRNSYQKTNFTPSTRFPAITLKGRIVPVIESEDKTTISFMTTSNRRKIQDIKQSNYAWVKYALETYEEEDEEGEVQKITSWTRTVVAHNPYGKEHLWEEARPQVILKNLHSLELHFWDRKKKDWSDSLKLLPKNEQMSPRAIKINLVWLDHQKNEHAVTRVFRPFWPYFDIKNAQIEEESTGSKKNKGDRNKKGNQR